MRRRLTQLDIVRAEIRRVKRRLNQLVGLEEQLENPCLPPPNPTHPHPRLGVDYSFGRPDPAGVHTAGYSFVCRYLSDDPGKDITFAEAKNLRRHGLDIIVVCETTANRAFEGRLAGVEDAKKYRAKAARVGQPACRPLFAAVDSGTGPGFGPDPSITRPYFEGWVSVLGVGRSGAYGGYYTIKYLFDHHLITFGWQAFAWSNQQWDRRAQLQQYQNDVSLAGGSVDLDRATAIDFGQWRV